LPGNKLDSWQSKQVPKGCLKIAPNGVRGREIVISIKSPVGTVEKHSANYFFQSFLWNYYMEECRSVPQHSCTGLFSGVTS
jgi:hypothetical protein